jgi:hypothetical protein
MECNRVIQQVSKFFHDDLAQPSQKMPAPRTPAARADGAARSHYAGQALWVDEVS